MKPLNKPITPHLWFDKEASAAAEFYCTVFPDSKIDSTHVIHDTPSGDCDIVSFTLADMAFQAISAGPYFKINPAVSFMVNYDPSRDDEAVENLNSTWEKLLEGGKVLMPLQEYSFSQRYGWIEDKFGVSWQLILTNPEGEPRPFIIPALLFVGNNVGRAEEAINFYTSIFPQSSKGNLAHYPSGMEPDKEGTLMFGEWRIGEQWFSAMDSAHQHNFAFNEGVSFIVYCETQEEIDYYWEKLSASPEAEQCGWLKDKYGLSWQVVPTKMNEMMETGSEEQIAKLTKAFLAMKKFNLADLETAFSG